MFTLLHFMVILMASGFLARIIYKVLIIPCMAPLFAMAALSKSEKPAPMYTVIAICIPVIALNVFYFALWTSFCVATINKFTVKPQVTWDWLYWLIGFCSCNGLVAGINMEGKDSEVTTQQEIKGANRLLVIYGLYTSLCFFVFTLNPSFAMSIFGWFLNLFGLGRFMQ